MADRTICVWESGGVYPVDARDKLAEDIARALGASPKFVKITDSNPGSGDGDGEWLTVQIWAPCIPVDWEKTR